MVELSEIQENVRAENEAVFRSENLPEKLKLNLIDLPFQTF